MPFSARILADSQHPLAASRLVTMELKYPRLIHAEMLRHRMFSRNASSSRAIPAEKMLASVFDDPFIPIAWGLNQKGMVAGAEHSDPEACKNWWYECRKTNLALARSGIELGLHKQIVNRILEPYTWITEIVTGVDHAWENFFKLRCAPDAEPHIQKIAYMARDLIDSRSELRRIVKHGEYHLPLFGFPGDESIDPSEAPMVSVARCARTSYLTHDGKRDIDADLTLFERLKTGGHWSPFEHVATPVYSPTGPLPASGNFGCHWQQYRKQFHGEYCTKAPRPSTQRTL